MTSSVFVTYVKTHHEHNKELQDIRLYVSEAIKNLLKYRSFKLSCFTDESCITLIDNSLKTIHKNVRLDVLNLGVRPIQNIGRHMRKAAGTPK